MGSVTVQDVVAVLNRFAPPYLAMQSDVIGLQLGRLDKPVKRIFLALDPYPDVVHDAIARHADMLVTHHAMLYRPLTQVDTSTARGAAIAAALTNDLTVFNAHTNLDIAEGGVNDVLASLLGMNDVEVLDVTYTEPLLKLVVFVPESHQELLMHAVCDAGAGHIGRYSHCTFTARGTGTFKPLAGTTPYLGSVGRIEGAEEVRMETIVPAGRLDVVLDAARRVHPYEEVAYDVYPTELKGRSFGIGRVGNLPASMSLRAFAELARVRLAIDHIRFSGDPHRPISRVAVLGGSGGRWVRQALSKGAQVLVTADCDHHTVAEAQQDGLAMVDATHAALELPVLRRLKEELYRSLGDDVEVMISGVAEDPFTWI